MERFPSIFLLIKKIPGTNARSKRWSPDHFFSLSSIVVLGTSPMAVCQEARYPTVKPSVKNSGSDE